MPIVIETFPVGPLQCNCTILGDPDTGAAIVVDPGGDLELIQSKLDAHGLQVKRLLHTHAHIDHILATRAMKEKTGATIHLHKGDEGLYQGIVEQALMLAGWGLPIPPPSPTLPVDEYLTDGEALTAGGLEVEVLHTPGHTEGSCCFGVQGEGARTLIAGDTLFYRSVGRTDLPGGDSDKLVRSIRQRLYTLDEQTRVVTGHGQDTTIGDERRLNMAIRAS